MPAKWSKIHNQYLHKNIQFQVGSNGIQFKTKPHGTLLSEWHLIILLPIKMLSFWETEIWLSLLVMNTRTQFLHSLHIATLIYMEMVTPHTGRLCHMRRISFTGIMFTLDIVDIFPRHMLMLNSSQEREKFTLKMSSILMLHINTSMLVKINSIHHTLVRYSIST